MSDSLDPNSATANSLKQWLKKKGCEHLVNENATHAELKVAVISRKRRLDMEQALDAPRGLGNSMTVKQ